MNKLLTLGLVGVVTAGVVWHQHSSLAVVRAEVRRLKADAEAVAGSIELAQQAGAQLEGEWAEEQAKAKGLRQDLAEWDARIDAAVELPPSLGPGQCWPANEPFCYLPKPILARLGYMTFNMEGHLTDEAALLYGLSRTERARVEDAYATFAQEVQAMDLAHLRRVDTQPHIQRTFPKDHAQSYALEAPPEQAAALQEAFEAAVREVLAGNRGDFFLQANRRYLVEWFKELDEAPLRITLFTSKKADQAEKERAMIVEFKVQDLASERIMDSKFLYPTDETSPGFQHFATLLRQLGAQSGQ